MIEHYEMVVQFKFVAVTSDGESYDPETSESNSIHELGRAGWKVVGLIPESSIEGFGHTLIMQRETEEMSLHEQY